MPVSLAPLTRRHWLHGSLATLLAPPLWGQKNAAPFESWVLFSDTHINADPATEARGVVMAENLARCVNQALKLGGKPFGVLINGDCAHLDGQPGDYAVFAETLRPLREAGVAVHCTLGNHDHRGHFISALSGGQEPSPLQDRHVTVLTSARVNWVLLDSLDKVNVTPGLLGGGQLGWLDRTLDKLPAKPTFVLAHHNPQAPMPEDKKHLGLLDSEELFQVLARHKKVSGFIFGHIHYWAHGVDAVTGIHWISLPPTAYLFDETRPNGWVLARAHEDRLELELRALNPAHDEHKQIVTVPYSV